MPGPRLPTDVIKSRGAKHLSKTEEIQRRRSEVQVPTAKAAKPPKWLMESLKASFRSLGKQLIAAGLYTDLDADTLGRYLTAQHQWQMVTEMAEDAFKAQDMDAVDALSRIQDRYFKQARGCANDMGLTVTSRCRLVLPQQEPDGADANPFLQLLEGGREHYG